MIQGRGVFTKVDHRASSVGVSLPEKPQPFLVVPAPTKYPEPHVEPSRWLKAVCWAAIYVGVIAPMIAAAIRWLA